MKIKFKIPKGKVKSKKIIKSGKTKIHIKDFNQEKKDFFKYGNQYF